MQEILFHAVLDRQPGGGGAITVQVENLTVPELRRLKKAVDRINKDRQEKDFAKPNGVIPFAVPRILEADELSMSLSEDYRRRFDTCYLVRGVGYHDPSPRSIRAQIARLMDYGFEYYRSKSGSGFWYLDGVHAAKGALAALCKRLPLAVAPHKAAVFIATNLDAAEVSVMHDKFSGL